VRNKNNLRFLVTLLFAATAFAALVFADLGALAQNANSSTTGDASAENANANMSGARRRGRRRGRRGRRRATAATAAAVEATEAAATGGATQTADDNERADLSGTYTGHVMMSGGHDMEGDGTLTITGNTFQLESGGMTHGGRVYAVTTRGYTGAAFYFTDLTNSGTNTPVVANVRARKSGDSGLWLGPVPGTSTKMMFSTGGGMHSGGRHRGRRGRRRATTTAPDANANTGDNTNATPPM
jgi:hypothetical protein